MKVFECTENESGIVLVHKALPAAMNVVYYSLFVGFGAGIVWSVWSQMRNGGGSWLPPLDQLPPYAKDLIVYLCLGISLLICLIPFWKGARVLLWGEKWQIDVLRHVVLRNEKEVANFVDLSAVIVEGDFRGDGATIRLYFLTREDKKIWVADGVMFDSRRKSFADAAKLISERTRIPYRKTTLSNPREAVPTWWEEIS